jgi:mRNA interferase HicA
MKYSELLKLLKMNGWQVSRQKGSHMKMVHAERTTHLIIPFHPGKEVKKGLLASILKQAGINTRK